MDDPLCTPLELAPPGLATGRELWLKREDVHETGVVQVARRAADAAEIPGRGGGYRGHRFPFFEDGAETTQFVGYRTIGEEILEQSPRVPAAVIVPVGNAALLVGVGSALGKVAPNVERVGVVAAAAPVMALSYNAAAAVACDGCDTFADGLAIRVAIPRAVAELQHAADRVVQVTEREIARAVGAYARAGIRAEGAAGAGLAALGQVAADPVVVIVCGSNIDDDLHARAVKHPESFPP